MSASNTLKTFASHNRSVKVSFDKPDQVTSDAGAFIGRRLLDLTGLIAMLMEGLKDSRDKRRVRHSLPELLQQVLLSFMQGWDRLRSAEALKNDPAFRVACRNQRGAKVLEAKHRLASQPTLSRTIDQLSEEPKLQHLSDTVTRLGMETIYTRNGGKRVPELVIDVDSYPVEVYGKQEGSEYNAHYRHRIYLPMVATCGPTGDVLGAELRPGAMNDARDSHKFIHKIAKAGQKHVAERIIVRADAGFNSPITYERLEDDGIDYVMRLKKNKKLKTLMEKTVAKYGGSPTHCIELTYKAESWNEARRVVMVPKTYSKAEPEYYFLLTSLSKKECNAQSLADFYRMRGKAEAHHAEIKYASCMLSSAARPNMFEKVVKQSLGDESDSKTQDESDNKTQDESDNKTQDESDNKTQDESGNKTQDESDNKTQDESDSKTQDEKATKTVRPQNAVRLLLNVMAYQLIHIGRCQMIAPDYLAPRNWPLGLPTATEPPPTDVGPPAEPSSNGTAEANTEKHDKQMKPEPVHAPLMHVRRFRENVLKVGGRLTRHARRLHFYLAESAKKLWETFWENTWKLRWQTLCWPSLPKRC